jgi:glycine/D-amino acid oxidase-like deaminating enzyme
MHTAVVGVGLAGTLLAWRLARRPGCRVTLIGPPGTADATAASGGLVRGFEADPGASWAATRSLVELLASPTLRGWSGYRETGSLYVCPARAGVERLAAAVEAEVAGSVRLLSTMDMRRAYGFAGLPDTAVGVAERRAGWFSPDRLRTHVLGELAGLGVARVAAPMSILAPDGACLIRGAEHRYDRVVLATGRWTGRLLERGGVPCGGYRTKLIQYGVSRMSGAPLPAFVDDTSGLYGRSTPDGAALLGLPSDGWDISPDRLVPDQGLAARVLEVAAARLPGRRFGPPRLTAAADCYLDPPGLALRPVPGCQALFTFTGGSGGAAKTALAASGIAAGQLAAVLTGGTP